MSRPKYKEFITGKQLRAARALAGLSQKKLAQEAGLHFCSISYLERQSFVTTWHSAKLVIEVLDRHGVRFTCEPGPGVFLSTGNETGEYPRPNYGFHAKASVMAKMEEAQGQCRRKSAATSISAHRDNDAIAK